MIWLYNGKLLSSLKSNEQIINATWENTKNIIPTVWFSLYEIQKIKTTDVTNLWNEK